METNTLGGPDTEENNENPLSPKILLNRSKELFLEEDIKKIKDLIEEEFSEDQNRKSFLIKLENILTTSEEGLKKIKSEFQDAGWIVKEKSVEKKYIISLFNRSYKVWEFLHFEK
ncbi:MAG: hypothetical protein WCO35_00635 [Candidatus Nomurabacteria bacterium]